MYRRLTLAAALILAAFSAGAQVERGITSLAPASCPFVLQDAVSLGGSLALSNFSGSSGMGYSLDLSPEISWAVSHDLEIGLRGYYSRGLADIAHAGIDIEGITIAVDDYWLLSHHYGGYVFLRKYLPIGTSGRLALFVDAQLGAKGGQGINTDTQKGGTVGTYQKDFSFRFDVKPGVAVSVTPNLSLLAGLGIAGIAFSSVDQVHNQVSAGARKGFEASYAMNPFSLSVGSRVTFHQGRRLADISDKDFTPHTVVKMGELMGNFGLAFASGSSLGSELLLLADGISGNGNLSLFSPQVSFAYRDNASVGLSASFTSGNVHIDHFATGLPGSDLGVELKNIDASYMSTGVSAFHRNYLGIDRNGTFGTFIEVSLSGAHNVLSLGEKNLVDNYSIKTVFSPGVVVYVLPFVSLEASAGVADLSVALGDQTKFSGGMRFNLLNCKFGVSYHL